MKTKFLLLIGAIFLTSCATASLPKAPSTADLTHFNDVSTIGVQVTDSREGTRVGSIGATTVSVKEDLAEFVNSYLVSTLNQNLQMNVIGLYGDSLNVVSAGTNGSVHADIVSLQMVSADALMDPVDVRLVMYIKLKNGAGKTIYNETLVGDFSKWIGISIVDKSTGKLVESVVQSAMTNLISKPEFIAAAHSL
jgi:hypothetical protein